MPPPAAAARDGAPSLQRQRLLLLGLVLSSRAEQLPLGTVNPSPCLSCKGGYDFFDFGHSDCTGSCNNASSTSIPIDLCQFHGCCFNDSVPSTAACFERELGDEAQYVIDSKDVITLLGTHGSPSEEYAPRLWQGMLGDYYYHRWEMWHDHIEATLEANKMYDEAPYATALRDWQDRWLLSDTRYRTEPQGNAVQLSEVLFDKYSHLLRGQRGHGGRGTALPPQKHDDIDRSVSCDVVVVGGSVAGLSAAVTSAKEGANTCLLEPTDMLGGQMTANGIPALDFSPEQCYPDTPFNTTKEPSTQDVNMAHDLPPLLRSIHPTPGYRSTCWVSCYCYLPTTLANGGIAALVASAGPKLRVFTQTVLLSAETVEAGSAAGDRARDGGGSQTTKISSVIAVQRTATPAGVAACPKHPGYGTQLSKSMPDWYSPTPSAAFLKTTLRFSATTYLDTSYNGELLVLSGAPYLQGIDEEYDGDVRGATQSIGNDTIGQSFTMTYQVILYDKAVNQAAANEFPKFVPFPGFVPSPFRSSPAIHTSNHRLNWTDLWTRRRSYHSFEPPQTSTPSMNDTSTLRRRRLMDPPAVNNVSVGDVTLMAWPDNHWRYIFISKEATAKSVKEGTWAGGYDMLALDIAERYSYSSFREYRDQAPPEFSGRVQINSTHMGTCTGLTKMPYIRDGRRSLAVDNFIMTLNNTHELSTADDCAAIVGHGTDIWGHRMMQHPIDNSAPGLAKCAKGDEICEQYPVYMRESPQGGCGRTCVPLRAMTNKQVSNLWVSGYASSMTMMVNSALRMHPEEFQIGVGSGAAAAHMALSSGAVVSTEQAVKTPALVSAIRARILKHAPLKYGSRTWPVAVGYACVETLRRCVQVPGGGTFTANNTKPTCHALSSTGSPACRSPPLQKDEWLALDGSFEVVHRGGTGNTGDLIKFSGATAVKKSAINSSLQPPSDVVKIVAGQLVRLMAGASRPSFKVNRHTYVLLRYAEERCGGDTISTLLPTSRSSMH